MISYEKKCIFVHIPKCGGTSVENLIWPKIESRTEKDLWMGLNSPMGNKYQTGALQHLKAFQIREEVGADIFNEYFKFSFARNPWDKAVSQFTYTQSRPDLRRFLGLHWWDSFKTYLKKTKKKEHVQWAPQYQFLYDSAGELLVDYVGRLEMLSDDVAHVMMQLGMSYNNLPHEKKGKRGSYVDYYDKESQAIVAELYQKDIELFQYKFGE